MKQIPRLFAILLILLSMAVGGLAQDKPKPTLIDEFDFVGCEDLLARSDNLGYKLKENPSSSAYVLIYGSGNVAPRADYYAKFIHHALIGRYDNKFNATIVRSTVRDSLAVEFWLIPQREVFERPSGVVVAKIPFIVRKKMLFDTQTFDPCSNHIDRAFANVLKSNPGTKGYIVDLNVKRKDHAETAQSWLDSLRENNIPRRRLRVYFKNRKLPPDYSPYAEFWLVPAKKE